MRRIKETLHQKRAETEEHIRNLQKDGTQGVRYTAMMPDIPFLILGLVSDVGWIAHLVSGVLYLCRNGIRFASDALALAALATLGFGVGYLIYLNKIHEKEIATKHQKDLGFGVTVYSGLAGAVIGILQIVLYAGAAPELVWVVIGGFLNFASGLPIYLSFKKGIYYGVK